MFVAKLLFILLCSLGSSSINVWLILVVVSFCFVLLWFGYIYISVAILAQADPLRASSVAQTLDLIMELTPLDDLYAVEPAAVPEKAPDSRVESVVTVWES